MKKVLCVIAAVLALSLCLCACGTAAKPLSEIFAQIKEETGVSDLVEFSDAADLDRFYGIAAEDIAEFAGGINNSGVEQEEIVLVKAADTAAAARITEALGNRLNAKLNETKNYNPEQYAMIDKCHVVIDGLYVSLIISDKATQMTEIYQNGIGAA